MGFYRPDDDPGLRAAARRRASGSAAGASAGAGPDAPTSRPAARCPAADLPVSGLAPATPQASPQVHGMPERQVHGMPETNETDEDHGSAVERQQQSTLAAMQHPDPAADKPRPPSRRSHGGALPK